MSPTSSSPPLFSASELNMVSVTDVVSIASSDEEHSVGTHFDYDDADANVKLVSKAGALDVLQYRTDGDGVPLVIRITPENETRDDVDGGAIETDKRENNLSNEASDKTKKKSKPKTGKYSKRNSKAKGEIDAKGVIGTLNRNITTARNRKHQLTESKTLISPTVDDVIDNLIYTCDPLFEADYEGACVNLFQLDVGNEDPTERDDDTDESDDQFQSKIDRILSNEKDDVQNYDEFDMNGISALIKQKRETDDLVLSKGLIDAKLQETKEKLSDAMDGMKQLQRNNDELNEKVQRLETILSKKNKKA